MAVLRSFFLIVLLAACVAAQQAAPKSATNKPDNGVHLLPEPHATVSIGGAYFPFQAHWWNEHAAFRSGGNVGLIDRDGNLVFQTSLEVPNLDFFRVTDAVATKTGHAVASVQYYDPEKHQGSYLAEIDEHGRIVHQLSTFPFIPELVCPADDGTVWAFGWDFYRGNQPLTYPHRANHMFRHYSFAQGLLRAAVNSDELGNKVLFGHNVSRGTAVACTEDKAWAYYGYRRQFIAYDEKADSFRTYQVVMPTGAPDDIGISGFARTAAGDFYGSVNDGSRAWLGVFWLYVHGNVAEWIAIDTPGDFKTGIRVFGASGNDLVYSKTAWRLPSQLLFSTMPSGELIATTH